MGQRKAAVVVADVNGVILLWSGHAEDLIRYSFDNVVGQTLDVIVPPSYRDRHWRGFRAAMNTSSARSEDASAGIPVLHADGSVRRFPGRFTLLRNALGQAVGAAAVFVEPAPDDPPLYQL
jgi:PAS domain S-box-containing protein